MLYLYHANRSIRNIRTNSSFGTLKITNDKIEIYGIYCPFTQKLRYIGKSKNSENRLKQHINEALKGRRNYPIYNWIKKTIDAGAVPYIKIICVCKSEDWEQEERKHIKLHRDSGDDLLNLADGGSQPKPSKETNARNIRKTISHIYSDEKRKKLFELKKKMGINLNWMNKRDPEAYNRTVLKLRDIAKRHPELVANWANLKTI